MNKTKNAIVRQIAVATLAIGVATPCLADDFPAGQACPFGINIEVSDGRHTNFREFLDKDGNFVKFLITGNSPGLVVTNTTSGESYALKSRGQQQRFTPNADGSETYRGTGHTLIIYFDTDVPGPAAIAYIGQVVVQIDAGNVFTLLKSSGKEIDVCALLE
jgi:hypothetical protein